MVAVKIVNALIKHARKACMGGFIVRNSEEIYGCGFLPQSVLSVKKLECLIYVQFIVVTFATGL